MKDEQKISAYFEKRMIIFALLVKLTHQLVEDHFYTPPNQLKRETNENNKDTFIASLKRKIKKLDEENKELHEQLKFAYAEVYKKI